MGRTFPEGFMSDPVQDKVNRLNREYEVFIRQVRNEWLAKNRPRSRNVLEVMTPREREEVDACMKRFEAFITPIAEKWWRDRGFGVKWPKDNSKPMQVYQLEDAST